MVAIDQMGQKEELEASVAARLNLDNFGSAAAAQRGLRELGACAAVSFCKPAMTVILDLGCLELPMGKPYSDGLERAVEKVKSNSFGRATAGLDPDGRAQGQLTGETRWWSWWRARTGDLWVNWAFVAEKVMS